MREANTSKQQVCDVISRPDDNELPPAFEDMKEANKFVTKLKSTANGCKSMINALQRLER